MEITAQTVAVLNSQLSNIANLLVGLTGEPREAFAFAAWGAPDHAVKVISICSALLGALVDGDGSSSTLSTLEEVYAAAAALAHPPHFLSSATGLDYRLLQHLLTEVQAGQLLQKEPSSEAMDVAEAAQPDRAQEHKQLAAELAKACQLLDIDSRHAAGLDEVLDIVTTNVSDLLDNRQLLLDQRNTVLPPAALSPQQRTMLSQLEEDLFNDFLLRRKMVLERLDVTLLSFLGSAEGSDDLQALIRGHRLHPLCRLTCADALAAPGSLLVDMSRAVTSSSSLRCCAVKKAVIGAVPDRGGRANEVRASTKRAAGGGRGGGGGGHRGGGGGGRGGGGAPEKAPSAAAPQGTADGPKPSGGGGGGGGKQQHPKKKPKL